MAKRQNGVSGSTRGRRTRGRSLTELLKKVGEECEDSEPGEPAESNRERVARALWAKALKGDLASIRLILSYVEGAPMARVAGQVSVVSMAPFTADEAAEAAAGLERWREERALTDGGTVAGTG